MSLAEALERAASALPGYADEIRPANGDAYALLSSLSQEGAGELLTWLLTEEAEAAGELCDDWMDTEAGVQILAAQTEADLPKVGRKVLRKAHHRLRTSGVEIASPTAKPVVARLGKVEEDFAEGFVSAPDPRGIQLAFLVESRPNRSARIYEVLLDAGAGIRKFSSFETKRGEAKQFLRSARAAKDETLVPASAQSLRALYTRCAAQHSNADPLPREYIEMRHRFEVEGATETPGDEALRVLGEQGQLADEGAVEGAVEVLERFGPWGPADSDLLKAAEEAAAGLSEEDAVREAGKVLLSEAVSASLAARFREASYVFWKQGEEKHAQSCGAAVQFLAQSHSEWGSLGQALVKGVLGSIRRAEGAGPEASSQSTEEGDN
ncbi:MAG: hypothetical protein JRC77_00040 [Deltaproteobacteria bacterium]|nr:hypothetical protein [Deltaproteobacteria bacterium]